MKYKNTAPYCYINKKSLYPYQDYFSDLNDYIRDRSFPTFVKRTNEKEQTIQISSAFLDDYLPRLIHNIQQCQVLDIGVGEGDLSSKFASYMKDKCSNLRYEGIDKSEQFVASATKKLITIRVEDHNIISGDCFGSETDKLVNHPTLLIASQVVFYAPNMTTFVDKIIKKMGAVAIIIGQSDFSFLNELNKKYASKQNDTETQVNTILKARSEISYVNMPYASIIEFPNVKSIEKIAYEAFDSITDQEEKEAREILEFIAGAPLEYIEYMGKLPDFIKDVKTHLKKLDGNIGFWNFMSIIVPSKDTTEEELQTAWSKIQKQKFSKDLTFFENALKEENSKVIKELFKSGIVLPDLRDDSKNSIIKTVGNRLSEINIFGLDDKNDLFSVDDHFINQVLATNNTELARVLIEKFALSEKQALALKEELTAKDHEYKFLPSLVYALGSIVAYIFLGDNHSNSIKKPLNWAFGIVSVNAYVIYKYSSTGYSILHKLTKINELQSTKYILKNKAVQKSINDQTEEGQTALHIAAKANFTDVAFHLLSYEPDINIPDYKGKLAIHYAVENNNYPLFRQLLDKGNNVNATVYNADKNIYDEILFWGLGFTVTQYFLDLGTWPSVIQKAIDKFNKLVLVNYFNSPHTISTDIFFGYSDNQMMSSYSFLNKLGVFIYAAFYGNIKLFQHPILAISTLLYFSSQTELSNLKSGTDDSFWGYSYDSLFHLAAKNNNMEIMCYLLEFGANIEAQNANNETPLHIAASHASYESVIKLIEHGADPNMLAYTSKSILLSVINFFLSLPIRISEKSYLLAGAILTKLLHQDEFFGSLQEKNLGTPLFRALLGDKINEILQAKYLEKTPYKIEQLDTRFEIAVYLVNHGADIDHTLTFNFFTENWFINLCTHVFVFRSLSIIPSKIGQVIAQGAYFAYFMASKIWDVDYLDRIIPYKTVTVKLIDFFDKAEQTDHEKKVFQYLKQHTVLNYHTDAAEMSFFNFKYLGYLLGMVSVNNVIEMNEYGMYKGGAGQDKFIINPNFIGKENGGKLIIKDYKSTEDTVDLSALHCVVQNPNDLKFEESIVMNKASTAIFTATGDLLVTLYDFPIDEVHNIIFSMVFKFSECEA